MTERRDAHSVLATGQLGLTALFVTALVTAQLTAAKVLQFTIPLTLPITGDALVLPGAALAYALTFFASDCYAEVYGRKAAQRLVNVAFVMIFVMLVLVWSTIEAPAAQNSVDPAKFRTVLSASTNIVVGSLCAYVVSQNWDVIVFHRIRDLTDGDHLWARNIGSTASSQAIDTVIFVGVAFYALPRFAGIGPILPENVILSLIVGQYVFKLFVALLDTPFVYAVVGFLRSQTAASRVPSSAD
ncbi:integral membrane-like protein [Haladaptatus sp. W1]|uniref:queuosine precursor transporter n=1 Tax=Haladaptatus sp. W1 TaxID=1897478 RepID=UPI000849DB1D|nr:queuosine precursor transporter [Haladaptatus sp. W1]ODR82371.1 integral membrane-like protein [Haladaptatus sp. W1]